MPTINSFTWHPQTRANCFIMNSALCQSKSNYGGGCWLKRKIMVYLTTNYQLCLFTTWKSDARFPQLFILWSSMKSFMSSLSLWSMVRYQAIKHHRHFNLKSLIIVRLAFWFKIKLPLGKLTDWQSMVSSDHLILIQYKINTTITNHWGVSVLCNMMVTLFVV